MKVKRTFGQTVDGSHYTWKDIPFRTGCSKCPGWSSGMYIHAEDAVWEWQCHAEHGHVMYDGQCRALKKLGGIFEVCPHDATIAAYCAHHYMQWRRLGRG